MITIIITTSNRLDYLKKTMNDLTKFKDIIDKIIIFCFNDLNSENYIKNRFNKKFKKIITIKSKNKYELENRIQYVSRYKSDLIDESKYVWFMNDKDRILIKNSNSIKMILKKNINGLTLNMHSLIEPIIEKKDIGKFILFNLEKGIHRLGLISSQILDKRLFIKYSKKTKLSAYYLSEIILQIIINEKKWYFYTQKIIGYTHLNRDKNRDKLSIKYLNYRVNQEFIFYILKLNKILSVSNYLNKEKIIGKAFFKNVFSWVILLKSNEKKINFSKTIDKLNKSLSNQKIIKFFLFIIKYTPNSIFNLLKKLRSYFKIK